MKYHRLLTGLVLATAFAAAACSTAATDRFIAKVDNFTRGLAAVDQAVKQVNAKLYGQCNELVAVAGSINDIAGQCSKAAPYTSVANAVINSYCQAPAAQEAGIAKSVAITATSVSAAKSTLAANKKACTS